MSGEVDESRLRNWVRAFERLMRGGLGEQAHTACVDEFASDEGEYPYVTPGDVSRLLDEVERLRATLARVEALADRTDGLTGIHFMGSPFPPAVTLVDLRDSLSGAQDWRHSGTPDAQSARRSAAVGAEGHVSATDLAQAAARTKRAARGRVGRGDQA